MQFQLHCVYVPVICIDVRSRLRPEDAKAGVPPEVPSWGNIIAQGRTFFQIAPWTILIPGTFLAVTVLAVNLLGDGLRDRLDPRLARRL